MKTLSGFPIGFCLILLAGGLACREPKKAPEVAKVAQDTMLLRDLAEANKNTASAAAMDNSLNTVRTTREQSSPAMVDAAAQSRTPGTRVVARPPAGSSQVAVGQIYDLTFRYGRAGEASALSWILFVLILMITAVQIRGQRRWVHYA